MCTEKVTLFSYITLLVLRLKYSRKGKSRLRVLMTWLLELSGHQHWLCKISNPCLQWGRISSTSTMSVSEIIVNVGVYFAGLMGNYGNSNTFVLGIPQFTIKLVILCFLKTFPHIKDTIGSPSHVQIELDWFWLQLEIHGTSGNTCVSLPPYLMPLTATWGRDML